MDYTPKTFKLDNEVVAALEETAKQEDRTQTAIVERAIREYVAKAKADAPKTDTRKATARAA